MFYNLAAVSKVCSPLQVNPSKMREMANMMRTNPAAVNTWTSHMQNMSQAELDRLVRP